MSISVVISTTRLDKNLILSLNSILNQTFKKFELLLYLDINFENLNSTNDYIKFYNSLDNRISTFSEGKKGLAAALNFLISKSQFDYIARMDDDDLSHPKRFHEQIIFLKKNKDIDVVGTQAYINSNKIPTKLPLNPKSLKFQSNYKSIFIHPSIMARKSFFIDSHGYDESYELGQDFEIFNRMNKSKKYSNIDIPLLVYNKNGQSFFKLYKYLIIKIRALKKNNKLIFTPYVLFYFFLDLMSNL